MKPGLNTSPSLNNLLRHGCASLLVLFFAAEASLAATISWSGAGGDELWSNPTNWTGGVLPTSDDDVVINVPGNTTVRMDVYQVAVGSLQCSETFVLEQGPFRVTSGASSISGAFIAASPYYGLEAQGAGTVLTLSGAVTNAGSLSALDGAVIAVPGAHRLTVESAPFHYSWLYATDAGSAIIMTNLTNVFITPPPNYYYYNYFKVDASAGGRIDLRRLQNPEGPLSVTAANPNSRVDLSGMSGLWKLGPDYYLQHALSASDEGTIVIPNVTAFENVNVTVAGMTNMALAQVRSFTLGTLSLTSRTNGLNALTNFIGSLTTYDSRLNGLVALSNFNGSVAAYNNSRLDLTNVTSLHATDMGVSISADQGSIINLSRVTNVTGGVYPFYFSIGAQGGSHIDFRGLRLPTAPIYATSDGTGSVVDLAGLVGNMDGGSLKALNGASLLVSNITSLRDASLDIRDTAVLPTVQLHSVSNVSITLYGRTNGLEGLTNFSATIDAHDNTRLDLTNFTSLDAGSGSLNFQASGYSLIDLSRLTNFTGYLLQAYANSGSHIDLSRLRIPPEGNVYASASGADSVVDLSAVSGVWRGSISADGGGTVLIPNVTALENSTLTVSDDANVNLAQLTSITASSVTLTRRTNDLSGLPHFTGSLVADGSELALTNLTELYATNAHLGFEARGGSINLSNVTNVVIHPGYQFSLNGNAGSIDVHRARVPEGTMDVRASGPGGVVDLSALAGLWTPGPNHALSSVQASQGGSVLISNVTAMHRVKLSISDEAVVPTAQLTSYTEGGLIVSYRTNVFSSLTNLSGTVYEYAAYAYNAHLAFPSLTHLHGSNYNLFRAETDAVIDLTQVTNSLVGAYYLYLYAFGGHIELPGVESIAGSYIDVRADGPGSVVDLRGLTAFFSDNNSGHLIAQNGGEILLNTNAMLLAGVAIDFQSNPGGVLPPFLAPSQSLVLYGQPWRAYRVESRNPFEAGSSWLPYLRVPLTEPLQILGPRPPVDLVLRVRTFTADPPEVDIRRASPGQVELILFGVPGRTLRLESTTSLNAPIGWQNGPTQMMTNSFFIFPSSDATNVGRFYRAREL